MKDDKTIKEFKEAKNNLDIKLTALISDFQSEFGITVTSLSIDHVFGAGHTDPVHSEVRARVEML